MKIVTSHTSASLPSSPPASSAGSSHIAGLAGSRESADDKSLSGNGSGGIVFAAPTALDGMGVHELIANCPPLDANSSYCNLLQTSHFAETCIAAKSGGKLLGFVSGYLIPSRTDTLFIWQVAVAPEGRGKKLATTMLLNLLARPACEGVSYLETTITLDNEASWALFKRLAASLGAGYKHSIQFDQHTHFQGQHATEYVVRIGSFSLSMLEKAVAAASLPVI